MILEERIKALGALRSYVLEMDERLMAHMHRALHANPWFTLDNQEYALKQIATKYLDPLQLSDWTTNYGIDETPSPRRRVGIVAAGNIPMVAFQDMLTVFVSGHKSVVKLSERDPYLMPFLIKKLVEIAPEAEEYFEFVDRLEEFDAVIATGSNNSARYFEQYFGKYPNIIRKNRNAVAVLTGQESPETLEALGNDVFRYFGLGCRNVSHLFLPKGYQFETLYQAFEKFQSLTELNKYRNNIDYNLAIYILNKDPYENLGSVLLTPSESLISPVGCLHYTEYSDISEVENLIKLRSDDIQCIVSEAQLNGIPTIRPGYAQQPALTDYADGVDTMAFVSSL